MVDLSPVFDDDWGELSGLRCELNRGDNALIRENLIAQLTSPVRWTQTVRNMVADGASEFTELGPGAVLAGLVSKIASGIQVSSKQTL